MMSYIMKVFKIRNKETGLFSKGGTSTSRIWVKEGKSWSNMGHLKNHLNQFIDNGQKSHDYPYENAEIVEVEINYEECFKIDVNSITEEITDKKLKEIDSYKEQVRKNREEAEIKRLKELKEKYPNI